MPYKLRNNRHHKFNKTIYKITNWPEYNQALINRGSIILWLSPEIIKAWRPKKRKLHLTVDRDSHAIIAQELTTNSESDDSQITPMLENITTSLTHFAADKAHDKFNAYQTVHDKAGSNVTITIRRLNMLLFMMTNLMTSALEIKMLLILMNMAVIAGIHTLIIIFVHCEKWECSATKPSLATSSIAAN